MSFWSRVSLAFHVMRLRSGLLAISAAALLALLPEMCAAASGQPEKAAESADAQEASPHKSGTGDFSINKAEGSTVGSAAAGSELFSFPGVEESRQKLPPAAGIIFHRLRKPYVFAKFRQVSSPGSILKRVCAANHSDLPWSTFPRLL